MKIEALDRSYDDFFVPTTVVDLTHAIPTITRVGKGDPNLLGEMVGA